MAQGFGHVVHRERGHGYGGERFHFHAGFVGHAAGGADVERAGGIIVGEFKRDFVQRQWVAERDEVGGLFGGHDAGNLRGGSNRAFARLAAALAQRGIDVRREGNARAGNGFAAAGAFVANVHHVCVAVAVKMGEGHRCSPRFASLRGC